VSPRAQLVNTFSQATQSIDIQCKVNKTVCMSYAPKTVVRLCRTASIDGGWHEAKICIQFCYLGHILQNSECDDDDIAREIRNLFVRTNILKRMFHKCSLAVKLTLCFYDIGLRNKYTAGALAKFKSCYYKCIKAFLDSVLTV